MIGLLILIVFVIVFSAKLPHSLRFTFYLTMLLRLGLVLVNVLLDGKLPGSHADAITFFNDAVENSNDISKLDWSFSYLFTGSQFIVNIHAIIQWALKLGDSDFLLSHTFSLLGSAVCLFLISKIWLLIFPTKLKKLRFLLVIYTITPSVITNQSYILREVWQSLCILGVAYLGLSIRKKGYSLSKLALVLLLLLFGAMLHSTMIIMMIVSVILSIYLGSTRVDRKSFDFTGGVPRITKRLLITIVFVFCIAIALTPVLSFSPRIQQLQTGEIFREANIYAARGLQGARAEYGAFFQITNPLTILPTFLSYQLMPTPNRVTHVFDIVISIENYFRLFLVIIYISNRSKLSYFNRTNGDIFLMMWFMIELIWSIGTLNWGTAARHHVPAYGLLLLNGFMALATLENTKKLIPLEKQNN
ncbi:hypothetical protein PN441_04555 [Spirulina major CS-329]|uniref:hypothetical protein n=1 Tax=Spirulina TaxID=1154 RepID=UPI00233048F2|nr:MULTISPECIES: hypothetical protein [Spirulina]MDB9494343.1 hypothetical protein [Spirulina subsalsa CS-330]MDB9502333.1 hypothetical protein [Spirulina major CS-329]